MERRKKRKKNIPTTVNIPIAQTKAPNPASNTCCVCVCLCVWYMRHRTYCANCCLTLWRAKCEVCEVCARFYVKKCGAPYFEQRYMCAGICFCSLELAANPCGGKLSTLFMLRPSLVCWPLNRLWSARGNYARPRAKAPQSQTLWGRHAVGAFQFVSELSFLGGVWF